ncbi:3'-5' exonuclease [Parasphingorhabdus pacifica]
MDDTADWTACDYVVIDVEGNGQRPPDLVELASVPISGGVIGEPTSWLVRPQSKITWQARKIHGLSDRDVAGQPAFEEVADEVLRHLGSAMQIGHNVRIDLDVMSRKLPAWRPVEAFDTLRMARATWSLSSFRLGALVEHRGLAVGVPDELRPHRAEYDALVTARLFVDLANNSGPSPWTVAELRKSGGIALARPEPEPGLFD